jgi:uncharacterized protein (TIGR00251 family)
VIRETEAGVVVDVRVIPRAGRTFVDGVRDHAVLIRVAAPPVDNAANQALIEFFSKSLKVARHAVTIVAGATSRNKRVAIAGVSASAVQALVDPPTAARTRRSPS